MDIAKTKEYYSDYGRKDVCTCAYCQNLVDEIKTAYPELTEFLASFGVNIERPFEAMLPYEINDETYFEYPGVQYLICGNSEDFVEKTIGDVDVFITTSHPTPTYKWEYFIIECFPVRVRIRSDKYNFKE